MRQPHVRFGLLVVRLRVKICMFSFINMNYTYLLLNITSTIHCYVLSLTACSQSLYWHDSNISLDGQELTYRYAMAMVVAWLL